VVLAAVAHVVRRHWEHCPGLTLERAEMLPNGYELWVDWLEYLVRQPETRDPEGNEQELDVLHADEGERLGFVRLAGRRE